MGLLTSRNPGVFRPANVIHSGSTVGALTVGTAVTPVRVGDTNLDDRHTLVISNVSTNVVYIGFENTVTVGSGLPIPPDTERVFDLDEDDDVTVYAIAAAASEVRIAEVR